MAGNNPAVSLKTAETDPAVSLRLENSSFAIDYLKYLCEYEDICKTAFSPWLRALGGIVWWKNGGWKSHDTVPLTTQKIPECRLHQPELIHQILCMADS
jgi:hypothetical protein